MAFWKLLARGILEQVGYDVVGGRFVRRLTQLALAKTGRLISFLKK
jgi:hypothetical protein